jgi:hypothetical protein
MVAGPTSRFEGRQALKGDITLVWTGFGNVADPEGLQPQATPYPLTACSVTG